MYTICWILIDDPESLIHRSPNLFERRQAEYLTREANHHFVRAHHWVERA